MIRVTNTGSREPVHFTVGVKDGKPDVRAILPGKSASLPLPEDHPKVVAARTAGLVTVEAQAPRSRSRSSEPSDA